MIFDIYMGDRFIKIAKINDMDKFIGDLIKEGYTVETSHSVDNRLIIKYNDIEFREITEDEYRNREFTFGEYYGGDFTRFVKVRDVEKFIDKLKKDAKEKNQSFEVRELSNGINIIIDDYIEYKEYRIRKLIRLRELLNDLQLNMRHYDEDDYEEDYIVSEIIGNMYKLIDDIDNSIITIIDDKEG